MNLDEIRVTLSLRLCVRRTIPSSRVQAFRRDRFISSGLANRDAMMQPVHAENNNSALDMESLEEMLRKVTQSWISDYLMSVLDGSAIHQSNEYRFGSFQFWTLTLTLKTNSGEWNYYYNEWSARNSKTPCINPRDGSLLCLFVCPKAQRIFPQRDKNYAKRRAQRNPPRGGAGFQHAAIFSNVFRQASLNGPLSQRSFTHRMLVCMHQN
jgi:hypothetical protein